MPRKTSVQPGEVLRGWRVKLYPTQDQADYLRACQRELMSAWNLLVTSRETHLEHCMRAAELEGVIGPEPERPTPEMMSEVWRDYWAEMSERRKSALTWALKQPGLGWDNWKHDYKRLREVNAPERGGVASAQMYLSLTQTFQRTKRPRLKRVALDMPLLNRTGGIAARGIEGYAGVHLTREAAKAKGIRRVCQVHFGSHWIKARFGDLPCGPFIEGVAISREGNDWFAALRYRALPRPLPKPTKGSVGVNLGLIYTCTLSDGRKFLNPRGNDFALRARALDEALAAETDPFARDEIARRKRHLSARFARKAREQILTEILPALADYAEIVVGVGEDGVRSAAQGKQCQIGKKDGGGYVSVMGECLREIKLRYGEAKDGGRVREVEWSWISQICSRCQHPATKPVRGSGINRKFVCENARCPEYGIPNDPDVNAARNALRRPAISKEAAE